MTFKTLIMFLVIAGVVIFVLKMQAKRRASEGETPEIKNAEPAPYYGKTVLTEPEQVLFHRLREAVPEKIVLAQVAMNALIGIRKNKNWQSQFNAISKKYVDFVVCMPDFSVIAVIELDDRSHDRNDRMKSDEIKNAAFETAGYPIIRFHVKDMPSVERIRNMIGY